MPTKEEKQQFNAIGTTGHEWDGIQEYNNPLPRWWVWVFYSTIVFSIGYWILYPAWPSLSGYTKGVLGYSNRAAVAEKLEEARAAQADMRNAIAAASLEEIEQNPKLLEFALAGGKSAFGDNCAVCHGSGAAGSPGYPNLNDDDWLWGGTLEDIHHTIQVGVRSTSEETRSSEMPAFGVDGILDSNQINDVAEYVLSFTGKETDAEAAERGAEVFADNCAVCHGENGDGDRELGAPKLNDTVWLYGGDKATVVETITKARYGVMPTWEGRLDPVTIKQLAVYVHSLGGGE